jgi:hypothetical protein
MKRVWSSLRANWALIAGFALLIGVAGETVMIRKQTADVNAVIQRQRSDVVAIGDHIGDLVGTGASRLQVCYRLTGVPRGSLVIGMSSGCPFCQRSFAAWRRLSAKARLRGIHVIWVSRDSTEDASSETGVFHLDESGIADPSYRTYLQLKLSTVPQTLVVQSDGRVKDVRAGPVEAQTEVRLWNSIEALAHGRR